MGIDKKLKDLAHHKLFDVDFDQHASSIYDTPEWPKEPCFMSIYHRSLTKPWRLKAKKFALFDPHCTWIEDTRAVRQVLQHRLSRMEHLPTNPFGSMCCSKSSCVLILKASTTPTKAMPMAWQHP